MVTHSISQSDQFALDMAPQMLQKFELESSSQNVEDSMDSTNTEVSIHAAAERKLILKCY
jgi:hypothetical protein